MNVLIVGGGGREHALAWCLSQSPRLEKLYCAPGNAGIAKLARCLPVEAEDIEGIAKAVMEHDIGLAVIGPEVPLAMGIVDVLEASGTRVFGPNKKCSQLEASKAFTKDFLARHNIPTAKYKVFTEKEELLKAIGLFGFPMVIKADGLAAGKGVVIAKTAEEAKTAIEQMMGEKVFGAAGERVVVEEFISGVEASVLCFVDENIIVPMESAQDYKRIYDDDEGPNTGGMGAYSPSLLFDEALKKRVMKEILAPTLEGLQIDGLDYKGVLYAGLMITGEGPKVIEFNIRFGDPETQAVLPRLETDLLDVFLAVAENNLAGVDIKWNVKRTVCVVLASDGYPGSYDKGFVIEGLDNMDSDIWVFHAGTALSHICNESLCRTAVVTAGGRVLGVAAAADSHEEARAKAYENAARISFKGAQYRKDIGLLDYLRIK
ncbi:MAG: phosphoribosylamine--glycine ligase [Clostridiales bacterium]|nr:phosphoribosylamine--glycine ligase [Clostridiales bacterium]